MPRILCAGLAAADFVFRLYAIPASAEKHRARDAAASPGGGAANAAIAIARHGGAALLAARIGKDEIGDLILTRLAREDVDAELAHRSPGGTSSFSSIFIDTRGERQIVNFRGKGLVEDTGWLPPLPTVDAVLADTRWSALTAAVLAHARRLGVPGVVDVEAPVDPAALADASHLAFSMQGLADYAPGLPVEAALAQARRDFGVWACVTDGAARVRYTDGDAIAHIPAFPVEAVDTLSAGDDWHGVFALSLVGGDPEPVAIRWATAAAALKCLCFGGVAAWPDASATRAFLAARGGC